MSEEIEEGSRLRLDWGKLRAIAKGKMDVIPAVAQDVGSGAVVMVGYVNRIALEEAWNRRCAVFWSTSRNELWVKGATSGNVLPLEEIRVNCEQNSLLYRVRVPEGSGACHTSEHGHPRFGCYYRRLTSPEELEPAGDAGCTQSECG